MLQNNINGSIVSKNPSDQKIAIAISGGADSTALLLMLKERIGPEKIVALTVDHGLRPEALQEAHDVKSLCLALNIEHHILSWKPSSKRSQKSARDARYHLLSTFCKEHQIKQLFTAHHQDDLLETFVMRIWQKSNLLGLASISASSEKNDITLVRPLLNLSKSQLVSYLEQKKTPYSSDPSNHNKKYLRTTVRLLKLPLEDKALFLKLINLVARLRSYLEKIILREIQEFVSWETPFTLKINSSFFEKNPKLLHTIFIEKIVRIMGYTDFFKSQTTSSILERLKHKSATTGYALYWSCHKDAIYVSCEKKPLPTAPYIQKAGLYYFDLYTLEVDALCETPSPFQLKFMTRRDCIHLKKSAYINFLFSKTRAPLGTLFFEDLIVFLDEVEYHLKELGQKGWNLKHVSSDVRKFSFTPFLILPNSGVACE